MNPIFRIILILYAVIGLFIASIVSSVLMGLPWPGKLIQNMLQAQGVNGVISVVFVLLAVYTMISLIVLWLGLKRDRKHAIVREASLGNIRIALSAIETLVEKVSMEQKGVKEAKAVVVSIPQGVGIRVRVTVTPDINVPQLSELLQQEVLEKVKEVTGMEVKDIRVSVENISANKPRVE